mgnify:FL=1|jgi:hypothetical protein
MIRSNRHKLDNLIVNNHATSYAPGIPYYDLKGMEESISRAQRLWNRKLPIYDTMYLLHILTYGELQKKYKEAYKTK